MAAARCPWCRLPVTADEAKARACAACGGALDGSSAPRPTQSDGGDARACVFEVGWATVFVAGSLAALCAVTETGPYLWLMEGQLHLFDRFYPRSTPLALLLLFLLPSYALFRCLARIGVFGDPAEVRAALQEYRALQPKDLSTGMAVAWMGPVLILAGSYFAASGSARGHHGSESVGWWTLGVGAVVSVGAILVWLVRRGQSEF